MNKKYRKLSDNDVENQNNQEAQQKFIYEIWPGNNQFLFKGRLMFGPKIDNLYYLTSLLFIFFTFFPFQLLIFPYIQDQLISNLIITEELIVLISFFLLTYTDPGIIPQSFIFDKIYGNTPFPFGIQDQTPFNLVKDNYFILKSIDNKQIKYNYCKICEIYRPPKTHHCKDCNNCIELYDHHCPYIGNCVGKRNYRYFVILMSSLFLTGITQLMSLTHMSQKNLIQLDQHFIYLIAMPAIIIIVFIILIFINHFINSGDDKIGNWKISSQNQIFNKYLQPLKINWILLDKTLFKPRQKI